MKKYQIMVRFKDGRAPWRPWYDSIETMKYIDKESKLLTIIRFSIVSNNDKETIWYIPREAK